MSSKVIIPVSDFAAIVTRLEQVEKKLAERLVDGVYKYGPCLRCGYGPWDSSSAHEPRCCPRCHSAYWDRPPRKASARRPEDPPLKRWAKQRPPGTKRAVFAAPAEPVVEAASAPTSATPRPAVVLPPELRPPGEALIPPPPRALPDVTAMRSVDNPMNVRPVVEPDPMPGIKPGTIPNGYDEPMFEPAPTAHVAALPDAVVEAVLAGQSVTYEDIKAAKESGDVNPAQGSEVPSDVSRDRSTDPSLQAKKDAFFADAITAGLVASVVEREADPSATPFVTDAEPPSLAPPADDDPFWK